MLLVLDLENDTPIYTQLCNQIMIGIAKGDLGPEKSLPSVRQLAADLEINMHTVNKSYNILKTEGLIAIHKKKGVVVRKKEDMKADDAFSDDLMQRLMPIVAEAVCKGINEKQFSHIISTLFATMETGGNS